MCPHVCRGGPSLGQSPPSPLLASAGGKKGSAALASPAPAAKGGFHPQSNGKQSRGHHLQLWAAGWAIRQLEVSFPSRSVLCRQVRAPSARLTPV